MVSFSFKDQLHHTQKFCVSQWNNSNMVKTARYLDLWQHNQKEFQSLSWILDNSMWSNCSKKHYLTHYRTRLCSEGANLHQGFKPPPKVIQDSNPDPELYRIGPKMLWTSAISPSVIKIDQWLHANKFPKIPYSAMGREVEKGSRIRIWDYITIKS